MSSARSGGLHAGRHALTALGWAVGAGIGTALGGYLTAVSGAGAPGVTELDSSSLVSLPLTVAGAVFALMFAGLVLATLGTNVLNTKHPRRHDDEDESRADDRV